MVPLSNVNVTLIAVPYRQLSYIRYVFRRFDLLVLAVMVSSACHKKETEDLEKNPFRTVTVKAWLWRLISCGNSS